MSYHQSQLFNAWVVLRPAEDVRGQWVAHCLDLDAVTQGDSPSHALNMAIEASSMILLDDIERGVNPVLRRAPEQFWSDMENLLQQSTQIEASQLHESVASGRFGAFIVQMFLNVQKHTQSIPLLLAGPSTADALQQAH